MKSRTKRYIVLASKILFWIYLLVLLYLLFFSEYYGRTAGVTEYRYNLKLFREIRRFWVYREKLGMAAVLTNLVGNVVCFMPFGFFLPNMYPVFRKHPILVVLLGFFLTCTVEVTQLITHVGAFDVDDIFLNTCGTILGVLCNVVCRVMRRKLYAKKKI